MALKVMALFGGKKSLPSTEARPFPALQKPLPNSGASILRRNGKDDKH